MRRVPHSARRRACASRRLAIRNYKSIASLSISLNDRRFVIIEGENDVGKSNIVEAVELAFSALPQQLGFAAGLPGPIPWALSDWPRAWDPLRGDPCFRYASTEFEVDLSVVFSPGDRLQDGSGVPLQGATFGLTWVRSGPDGPPPKIALRSFQLDKKAPTVPLLVSLSQLFAEDAYRLVAPSRLNWGAFQTPDSSERGFRWHGNNLAALLFRYKNHPSLAVQERFELMRGLLDCGPLGFGKLNVAVDDKNRLRVRTMQNGAELDIESRSTGIQQFVSLLALALCHRGRILAIEEPELNLSRPSQRLLWQTLRSLVDEHGCLDQIFITSHSGIFEEEADCFVATRENGATAVREAPKREVVGGDYEELKVERDAVVRLPEAVQKRLLVSGKEHDYVFLAPHPHGYVLVGPEGFHALREEEAE